jgi:sugar lactone lactonase YvrE
MFRVFDRSGNLYKSDGDAHKRESKILKVTPEGHVSILAGGEWGHADGKGSAAKFQTPGVMVMGPDSALYLTEGGTVRRITFDGTVTTLAGPKQGFGDREEDQPRASSLLGIVIDAQRNIYAADWEERRVVKISANGNVTTVLESGLFWAPSGVAVVGEDLYVLEHRAGVTAPLEKVGFGGPRVRKVSTQGSIVTLGTAK